MKGLMRYRIAQQNTMNIVKEIKLLVFCSNSTIAKTSIVNPDNEHSIALTRSHYIINALNAQSTYLCRVRPLCVVLTIRKCRC